jgi:predicted aconitase
VTAPSPDDASLLAKIATGLGAALTALGAWAWKHTHDVLMTKADKEAFDRLADKIENHSISKAEFEQHTKNDDVHFAAINTDMHTARTNIAKIFDKLEDVRNTIDTKHIELLNAIHAIKSDK